MVSLKTNREYTAMTNQIIISNTSIHQDTEGRYSLNDLHKAAGCEQRHQPRYWLALDQTNELIEEILNSGISLFSSSPTNVKKGRYGGTYVCKELVYSYAMWISAAFALKVIRAYDDLVSGLTEHATSKTTVDERTPLRDAVNMLVSKKHLMYPEAYAIIHQRFNVESIEDLATEQLPMAVEYVHRLVLEGEFLGKKEALPAPKLELNYGMEFYEQYRWIIGSAVLSSPWRYPAEMLNPNGDYPNPIGRMLIDLKNAGQQVDAAMFQLQALQHHLWACRQKISRASMTLQ